MVAVMCSHVTFKDKSRVKPEHLSGGKLNSAAYIVKFLMLEEVSVSPSVFSVTCAIALAKVKSLLQINCHVK